MINLTKEKIVKEVDKEWATGKHPYLYLAKDAVAKKFNVNVMTLDNYYYKAKQRTEFKVWIEQVNQTMYEVKARDENEAKVLARRIWKKENKFPHIADIVKVPINKGESN